MSVPTIPLVHTNSKFFVFSSLLLAFLVCLGRRYGDVMTSVLETLECVVLGGGLACLKYGGDKAYSRRRNLTLREIYAMQSDALRGDIQLLSYYIKANKDRKMLEGDQGNTKGLRS